MPTEVGVLLIVSGIGGILLPGPVGTPFLILGCLMLWPKAFQQTGICFEKRFPKMHHHGVSQINRFPWTISEVSLQVRCVTCQLPDPAILPWARGGARR